MYISESTTFITQLQQVIHVPKVFSCHYTHYKVVHTMQDTTASFYFLLPNEWKVWIKYMYKETACKKGSTSTPFRLICVYKHGPL